MSASSAAGPTVAGVPLVFLLFAATLAGVLFAHGRAWAVALIGLAVIAVVRVGFSQFDLAAHVAQETPKLLNLFGLLVGFAVLADDFDSSRAGERLPRLLPGGRLGCFTLLLFVLLMSAVLDNIAAAMIGATIAARVFDGKVYVGYFIAIVAAANAGGAGSVIGDTTTTMMWLDGVHPVELLPAAIGAAVALAVFGTVAAFQQHRRAPLVPAAAAPPRVDGWRLVIVAAALIALIATNVITSLLLGDRADRFPFMAVVLWAVLGGGALLRPIHWRLIGAQARGSVLLIALVSAASLMPVDRLPAPGVKTTLGLGLLSAVFDNIPLTKLALDQGGYDWALLAFAVGFGGSMLWFGSSAGVAVASRFPEARSTWAWLRHGWAVPVAFVAGFAAQYAVAGWNP
ncbi:MAG TPA: citrate transporter [Polyangia bacterium]|nr:citrate transporter [Polyangia bacterium]